MEKGQHRQHEDLDEGAIGEEETQEHHGGGEGDQGELSLQGHAAVTDEALEVVLVELRVQEPGVEALRAPGKGPGGNQKKRRRRQHRENAADGAECRKDYADCDIDDLHATLPFCC